MMGNFDGIRIRIMALAVIPPILLAILLGWLAIEQRADDLRGSVLERGRLLSRQLALAASFGVFTGNRPALENLAKLVSEEPAVTRVAILDSMGSPLALRGQWSAQDFQVSGRDTKYFWGGQEFAFTAQIENRLLTFDESGEELVNLGSAKAESSQGHVVVELSTVNALRELRVFSLWVFWIVLVVSLITLWIASLVSRRITQPIVDLADAVERIGNGAYDVRLKPVGVDVLDMVSRGVTRMAGRLARSHQELEMRVMEATQKLLEKKDEAERANVAKTQFLAAASHDLRQPIHAISMFVAALERKLGDSEHRFLIGQVNKAVIALGDLLDSLLDISRLDSESIVVNDESVSLGEIFEQIYDEFAEIANAKGIALCIRMTQHWVRTDRALLMRVIGNLVSNAIRYTPSGRVLLAARRVGHHKIRLEVRDSGVGIPESKLGVIFDEFVQLSNSERDRSKGLGLGLAIVKRLAKLLCTEVIVRSKVSVGSVFSLVLPLINPEILVKLESVNVLPQVPTDEVRTIWVVDDDGLSRQSMETLLLSWGFAIVSSDGSGAFGDVFPDAAHPPDLLVCDLRLKDGADGIDLVQQARCYFGDDIPAIIVTGESENSSYLQRELTFPLLRKPVPATKLLSMIQDLVLRQQKC